MRYLHAPRVLFIALVITACTAQQDGSLQGRVSPPGSGVRVMALQQGRQVAAVDASPGDGSFRLALPAGIYDITISSPTAPYPLRFPGIEIRPSEATILPPAVIGPAVGSASVRGVVHTSGVAAQIVLLEQGRERASAATSGDGRYEFEGLPAGRYTVRVQAAGYAQESLDISVSEDQKASLDIRMLLQTALDGIDWARGVVRVRGIGLPPKQSPTPTVRREMAKRAALADAERNMLRAVEELQVGPGKKLLSQLGESTTAQHLQGYLRGYRIAAERDLDGGRIEIEIELPLTGQDGLMSMLFSR